MFIVYGCAAFGALIIGITIYSQIVGMCGYQDVASVPSPDGKWIAVHTLHSCEKQRPANTLVYLVPAEKRHSSVNEYPVLRADGISTEIGLTWLGDRELRITYPTVGNAEQMFATGSSGMDERMRIYYRALTPGLLNGDGS